MINFFCSSPRQVVTPTPCKRLGLPSQPASTVSTALSGRTERSFLCDTVPSLCDTVGSLCSCWRWSHGVVDMQVAWRGLVPAAVVTGAKIQHFFLICLASPCLVSFVERKLPHFWSAWPSNLVPRHHVPLSLVIDRWYTPPLLLWELGWHRGDISPKSEHNSWHDWRWPTMCGHCTLGLLHAVPLSSSRLCGSES